MAAPTTSRQPHLDLSNILAQPQPAIDLRVAALEQAMRTFSTAVATYKNNALEVINDRRSTHASDFKKLTERLKQAELETNQCKLNEIDLLAALEKEAEERKELEMSIASLRRQISSLQEKCSEVDKEISHHRVTIANLRSERDQDVQILAANASGIIPNLQAIEESLSFSMEGINVNQLLLRFWDIDSSSPEREMSCILDLSPPVYRVLTSSPPLPQLSVLTEELNASRNIYRFIRSLRAAFESSVAK